MTEPKINPLARRLAEENGIDWRTLEGSGPDGTIVERDILAFLAKVMAGEVELPPQPEDATPPEEIPDINQVQQALAREGVDLEELVPGITSEAAPEPAALEEEEEVLFELDFGEELQVEPEPEANMPVAEGVTASAPEQPAEPPRPEPSPWDATTEVARSPEEALENLEEGYSWETPIEDVTTPAPDLAGKPSHEELFDETASWEVIEGAEAKPEEAAASTPVEEVAEQLEEAVEGTPAPEPAGEPSHEELFDETASWEVIEEIGTEPEEIAASPVEELAEEPAAEYEAVEEAAIEPEPRLGEPVSLESDLEAEPETAAAEAPAQPVAYPPAFRRAVDLGALEKARSDLSEAWKKDVPPSLLLFRAVERALAELEVPMRPVLGRLRGEGVESLMVYPADNLRALYDNFQTAAEPAEGLVVIDLGETPYAEVLIPDTPLVTLGYSGMPAGMALLSVSGELPTDRTRFLERVAFYLERPILLA